MVVYIKSEIYSKMALDADTNTIITCSTTGIITLIAAMIIAIFKPLRDYYLPIMIFLVFIIVLPAFIVSTVATAALIETNASVSQVCPPQCLTTSRKLNSITTPSVITFIVAFSIGIVLYSFMLMKSSTFNNELLYKIVKIISPLLFTGIVISTVANYLYVDKIQTIMASGNCNGCT